MTWSLAKRTNICTHQRLRSAAHLHSLIRVFDGRFKGNQGSDISSGGKLELSENLTIAHCSTLHAVKGQSVSGY